LWYTVNNNNSTMWRDLWLTNDLVKVLNMFVKVFVGGEKRGMKSYPIREMTDYSWTRRKKKIKEIETFSNFSKTFIDVLNRAFEFCLLFFSKVRCQEFVGRMILGIKGI